MKGKSLSAASARKAQAGFSLLEVLIALGILSLAVGVVGIAAVPMIERRQAQADRQNVQQVYRETRYAAMLENRTLAFSDIAAREWPASERIASDIVVHASGICSGSAAELELNGRIVLMSITAPSCEVDHVQTAG